MFPAGRTGVGRVLVGVAAEEERGAGPQAQANQAEDQAVILVSAQVLLVLTLGLWTQSRQLLLIGAFQSGQQCNCACVSHHNPCRSADDQPFHHSPGPEWPSHHRQVVFVIIM